MLISQTELDSKTSRELIPLECLQCNNTHYRTKNIVLRILNENQQNTLRACFCSNECKYKHYNKTEEYCCKQCETTIIRCPSEVRTENIFCSKSCSAKYNNKNRDYPYLSDLNIRKLNELRPENPIEIKNPILKSERPILMSFCKFCNKKFILKNRKLQLYCSSKCHALEKQKIVQDKILNGEVDGHSSGTIKKYLIKNRGHKCEICNITEWNKKPIVLIMDHINGNSEDNSLLNLRLICSNCDSTLPTYKGKNKGFGRAYRRERYAQGKSY